MKFRRSLATVVAAASLAVGSQFFVSATPAEAGASCYGDDHRHWDYWHWHWHNWVHVRSYAAYFDGYWHVKYLYQNQTHGNYEWTGWCN